MIIVNKPINDLIDIQCYKCKKIFKVHPMQSRDAPFITDCELHNSKCEHECDGLAYYTSPPPSRCKKCGEYYR